MCWVLVSRDRVNVGCGPAEQRLLLTGLHSVADIFCESCKTTLGWKYVSPHARPLLGPQREPRGRRHCFPRSLLYSSPLRPQEQAFETSQKYKEGKYIIEMSHMVKDNGWD